MNLRTGLAACGTVITVRVPDVSDMDAAFDSGKSFAALRAQALHATGAAFPSFTPIPCVKINGRWYIDELATCGYIC